MGSALVSALQDSSVVLVLLAPHLPSLGFSESHSSQFPPLSLSCVELHFWLHRLLLQSVHIFPFTASLAVPHPAWGHRAPPSLGWQVADAADALMDLFGEDDCVEEWVALQLGSLLKEVLPGFTSKVIDCPSCNSFAFVSD